MVKKIKTKIKDLFILKGKTYFDYRGFLREVFKIKHINKRVVFSIVSKSKKNVIRGLHFQSKNPQDKLIIVLKWKILDVAIDLRKNSKTFGKVYSCILSEKNTKSIFIPEGFAHGFQGLEKENYIIYSCTKYREKNSEVTIDIWDKDLNIKWPIKKKIISKKDRKGITFQKYKEIHL